MAVPPLCHLPTRWGEDPSWDRVTPMPLPSFKVAGQFQAPVVCVGNVANLSPFLPPCIGTVPDRYPTSPAVGLSPHHPLPPPQPPPVGLSSNPPLAFVHRNLFDTQMFPLLPQAVVVPAVVVVAAVWGMLGLQEPLPPPQKTMMTRRRPMMSVQRPLRLPA